MKERLKALSRHGDFLTLVLLVVVCGALWGFIEIADRLRDGEWHAIDMRLLQLLRDPENPANPIGPRWVEELVRDASALGGFLVLTLLTVGAVVTLWMEKHHAAAVWLTTAMLGAVGMSSLFKHFFARERPAIITADLLPTSFSFPSGHAFLSAAAYLTIGALLTRVLPKKRTRSFVLAMALLLTLLTGFSRVYLGVHYPSDVLAGWTLGLSWAALCWLVAWKTRPL